ncbi:two-component system sensor histidine kinase NtrB [Geoalkalibacter halelectricus]|uniref:histidine kinase n=1 Tax=Geoalkalibacter halelectricus TaxID=2847045 RepID=A0ABY5ZQ19_9BACT|nr:ATP-binding protein [Geoalkalibacter halelectricus]MDO3377036.1 ATP-binding protein [Geoalkalibacter halelectricus]UWZ81257.1 ATP-binding protein [Geoalkalibacter halelectricus]
MHPTPPDPDSQNPQLYVRVLENVEDAVIALDLAGRVTLINPAAEVCTGISRRLALGRSFERLFQGQKAFCALVQAALLEGRAIINYEDILLHRPGTSSVPVSVSASPLLKEAGDQDGVVVILRDLSRVRELEEAVRRADRLSMVGTMAAGLAHEIKNPLGGIKGAAQLLDREAAELSHLREYTRVMIREVERVNGIIEELMDLASPRQPEMGEVHLGKILGDIVLFQKEALRHKEVEFILRLDPSIPPIRGDEHLLTRLFLNLIKNAGEAIEHQGTVEIVTRVASEFHLNQPGNRPIPFIVVEVRDTGKGITPAQMEQIFTPFFTTKTKGSGLGLAICQKIVTEHRGFLKVESRPGQGSSFIVSLPFCR